jgi:glyoxylase-like metal-dependent hydrolase (beta-lactamase superfamily II)
MVTLLRAPNPSAMTLSGTNSYLLDCGGGQGLIIDPGPAVEQHVEALLEAAGSRALAIRAIALTHGHPDHASGAPALVAATGAPVYAHPKSRVPNVCDLPLDRAWPVGGVALQVIDAPGHTFDHVVFYLAQERSLFTGDVVLGEGTSVIAPPSGAMRPYQRTLQRLADEFGEARTIYGGHGPIVEDARTKLAEYIEHRRAREEQILDTLRDLPRTIPEIVRAVYGPQRSVLWPAMARQVLAHLIALEEDGRVRAEPLNRPMTDDEMAMLNPRIEELVGPAEAAVITAELGTEMRLRTLFAYRLTAD